MTTTTPLYSQNNEQEFILRSTPAVGRFLDIGAWNAYDKSNTRALYERGWSGVLVEPSPEPFLGLLREYGNDERVELIHAAVGIEHTLIPFHATADAVSTSDAAVYERWRGLGGYYGCFHAPQITLEEIANQFGGFDMVSIDAEGTSADLFRQMMALGWRPSCVCVEYDDRFDEVKALAESCGYGVVHVTGENLVVSR